MRTLIIGLPYFAKITAKRLNEFDHANSYTSACLDGSLIGKISFVIKIHFVDTVYQIGGSTRYGKALHLAKAMHKKIIMHWVGTDVLEATEAFGKGEVNWELVNSSRHFCDADWLKSELKEIGINANRVYLSCVENAFHEPPALPADFCILTYIGKKREKFYGLEKIIALAEKFPQIPIRISTLSEYSTPLPKNIQLLGHVKDLSIEMKNCILFLRVPEHDGLSFSVNEALSLGRYVGYIYEYPETILMKNEEEMFSSVEKLYKLHASGKLMINLRGYEYIKNTFSREKILLALEKAIRDRDE